MLAAIVTLTLIALAAGLGLAWARRSMPASNDDVVEQINGLLPQTQCAQCGYPGCRPYAVAIADAGAPINLCPPGGKDTIRRLADLLGRDAVPLEGDAPDTGRVAFIDEARCIGCTHCITACPVDAIVGAQQFMHTVIVDECTGCDLCLAPCPVDCISMVAA